MTVFGYDVVGEKEEESVAKELRRKGELIEIIERNLRIARYGPEKK